MKGANLVLRLASGETKPVGKWVFWCGNPIFHVWAEPSWQRHDAHSWGINRDVATHLHELRGIRDFYIYDKRANLTYHTTWAVLCTRGTPGRHRNPAHRVWGENINLPLAYWDRFLGRLAGLAWIPEDVVEIVPVTSVSDQTRPDHHTKPVSPDQGTLW